MPTGVHREPRWRQVNTQVQDPSQILCEVVLGPENPNFPEPKAAADFPEATFNQTKSPWRCYTERAGMEIVLSHLIFE